MSASSSSSLASLRAVGALASGLLFGIGLVVSGMTRPDKVLGFLALDGDWDPSLAFVMVGGIGVHALLYAAIRRRWSAPLADERFSVPPRRPVDAALVLGAVVFGIGWGLAGYCPGPAVVSLLGGGLRFVAFFGALVLATFVTERVLARWRRADTPARSA